MFWISCPHSQKVENSSPEHHMVDEGVLYYGQNIEFSIILCDKITLAVCLQAFKNVKKIYIYKKTLTSWSCFPPRHLTNSSYFCQWSTICSRCLYRGWTRQQSPALRVLTARLKEFRGWLKAMEKHGDRGRHEWGSGTHPSKLWEPMHKMIQTL